MTNPESIDLTPYAKFGSGWWKCNLCREHGDRFHLLYHLRNKHKINRIPELPYIRDIRLVYTNCDAEATIDYLKKRELHATAISKTEFVKSQEGNK